VVPYVLAPPACFSDGERSAVRQMIGYEENCVYYLTITKIRDKRKNARILIDAFESLGAEMPDARLIIKASDRELAPRVSDPRIIVINADLAESLIAALYESAHVYLSAHHSEGWGFTIADALQFQKPTIATGYSGNLEFTNDQNSFLLEFEEDHIREEDVFGPFTNRMKWAYPSREDLEDKLLTLYGCREDSAVQEIVRAKLCAAADIHRFDPEKVASILRLRLEQIANRLAI